MRVAVIGCGEVGRCYAEALAGAGHELGLLEPNPTAALTALSSRLGITVHAAAGPWLSTFSKIIVTVSGGQALSVLRSLLPFLSAGSVCLDFTTASRADKRTAADELARSNVRYADVAIMGSVTLNGPRTPLLIAGTASDTALSIAGALGAPATALSDSAAGDAITIKLLRSLFTKGLEALTVECMIAAERQGLVDALFSTLSDIEQVSLRSYLEMLTRTHVVHARRREREVAEAGTQVRGANLPAYVLPGVHARFLATIRGLNEVPLETEGPTFGEALAWLAEISKAREDFIAKD